jgi:glycosyltransferase involved in cell wall biosynthesis
VLTVHEAWVAMRDWRSVLMGSYQRAQLRLLLQLADRVIVVRGSLARELGRACVHVPVASNITPTEVTPAEARVRLAIGGELVVGLFGTGRPERRMDHAEVAIAALAAQRGVDGLCVLNLGRDSLVPAVPNGVEIRTPGVLASDEVSLHLRATDLLLLPIADGLCTRRTTLMAGLAHGLPVLGLRGPTTDGVLVEHPDCVVLTPCGDLDTYARAAVQLAGDPARLRATGVAGRDLYRDRFDWPHTARMVLATLDLARSRS